MKRVSSKILFVLTLLAVLFSVAAISANAYEYEAIEVEIPVVIERGGTAVIITEEGSPEPEESEITIADGETGRFIIHVDTVGEYAYTVKLKPNVQGIVFDTTEYDVKMYITDEDGELVSAVIAYKGDYKYAGYGLVMGATYRCLEFTAKDAPDEDPDAAGRNPKTGDDTRMEQNFLIAMIASFGLLGLSIVYLDDSIKLVKARNFTP